MYQRRKRMEQKAHRTRDFLYVDCEEHYTSRTCSECDTLRKSFRPAIFECVNPSCRLVVNRDLNAAKNILIRQKHTLTVWCASTHYTHKHTFTHIHTQKH